MSTRPASAKPRLRRENGGWRAEATDQRGVVLSAHGATMDDAVAFLARSYQIPGTLRGEIASADPYRLFPAPVTPYNPSVLVQRRGLRVFDEMRRDDQVKAALAFKKHAVFAAGWRIESPEGRPEDWEPTAFVREQLEKLEGHFTGELLEMLTALDFGFSCSEKIFADEGRLITLAALKTRAPHGIDFAIDEHGNLLPDGILQWQANRGQVKLPAEKFVVVRNMREFGNPYGTSDLEAAYRPHWFKDNAYKWLGMLLERYGIPPILVKYRNGSLNDAQLEALKSVLTNLQAATAAMIPFGDTSEDLDFWSPELAGQVSRAFEPAIDMYNTDIARAVLMPGLLGLTPESRVGSMARARVVFDVFLFVRDFLADMLADTINDQIVRVLVDLNFAVDEYPAFRLLPIDDNLQKELFDSWAAMVTAGVVTPQPADEAHIRQLLEFPVRDEETMEEPPEDEGDDDPEDDPDPPEDDDDQDDGAEELAQAYVSDEAVAEIEAAVDMPAIGAELDRLEAEGLAAFEAAAKAAERALVSRVRRSGVKARLRVNQRGLEAAAESFVVAAFRAGVSRAKGETARAHDEPATALDTEELLEFLRERASFIAGIYSDRLLTQARQALYQSVKLGETTQGAVARLQVALEGELSRARLETIVRTNTGEFYNLGRLRQIQQSPFVSQVLFSSILDPRTTEVCRYMHGRVLRRDDPAMQRLLPPLHFNSFVSGTLVSTAGDIAAKATREYEGDIVSIRTASNKLLTGTPNHPILTDSGWIPLGRLNKGDRVVSCRGADARPIRQSDNEQIPSCIEDVPVASWSAAGVESRVMETAAVDFHGDGAGSEVCVVAADGLLWRCLYATRAKQLLQHLFARANVPIARVALSRDGPLHDTGLRLWLAPDGGVRGCGEMLAAFWAELLHAQKHGFAPAAQIHSRFAQAVEYRRRGDSEIGRYVLGRFASFVALHNLIDRQIEAASASLNAHGFECSINRAGCGAELLSNLLDAEPRAIEFDDVIDVKIEFAHRLVHCLTTTTGWYSANGIVASNCRSVIVPVPPSLERPADELISEAQKGQGIDLAQEGFA